MENKENPVKKNSPHIQMEVILDSIAEGVFTIDQEKNITSFNRAAEKITGIGQEQAIGQKCFDVFYSNICQSSALWQKPCAPEKRLWTSKSTSLTLKGKEVPGEYQHRGLAG
jgi:Transcriptional regulator containing PAS, AAA-type ATPase, and DNA-binding domains